VTEEEELQAAYTVAKEARKKATPYTQEWLSLGQKIADISDSIRKLRWEGNKRNVLYWMISTRSM